MTLQVKRRPANYVDLSPEESRAQGRGRQARHSAEKHPREAAQIDRDFARVPWPVTPLVRCALRLRPVMAQESPHGGVRRPGRGLRIELCFRRDGG